LMRDQINLTGRNPLVGQEPSALANRFVPMLDAFDTGLRAAVLDTASARGISVHEGVYLGLLGPSFETPAEIRAFAMLGADTVAMSVCEEVIAARHVGMRVAGMSLITNMACGVEGGDPRPDDILDAAVLAEDNFAQLVLGLTRSL
ncbi:MAG: purine-nucleoside phosphorylase, partial [Eggerthellaceae bacterium]